MKYFYTLIFCFLFFSVKEQTIGGNFKSKPDAYNSEVLDKVQYSINYQFHFLEKANDKSSLEKGFMVLQIGKEFVKFTDFYGLKNDSLAEVFSHYKTIGAKELNERISIFKHIKFEKNIFTNIIDNKILFQSNVVHKFNYEYEIEIPKLEWKIEQKTDEILGYNVQRATVAYGGRKWIAWFTPEIPIQYGPYVFNGLPGLIVKLHDDKNNFTFLLNAIDKTETDIYKRIYDNVTKTTKEKYMKVEKDFHDRPDMYFDNSAIRGGKGFSSSDKLPYNPIEVND